MAYYDAMKARIEQYLTENGIELSSRTRSKTGTKILSDKTKKAYKCHFKSFRRFCIWIGDVESLLLVHDKAPEYGCPPARPITLANYMRYRTMPKGSPLYDFMDDDAENEEGKESVEDAVVRDMMGREMMCSGGWKAPVNVTQFKAALSTLHQVREHPDAYKAACPRCVAARSVNQLSNGCSIHAGQFLFKRRGNATDSQQYKNAYKEALKRLADHEVVGAYQMLPWELRDIRQKLLSTNHLKDLQVYCGLIISIHLFLRHDEYARMRMTHIVPSLCQMKNGVPSRIAIKVKGKTDSRSKIMFMYRCDDVPEFCPIRHLLAYVYIANIPDSTPRGEVPANDDSDNEDGDNGPFIFPKLKNRTNHVEYDDLLKYLQSTLNAVMDRDRNISTHVFRKTGYLHASWGGADFDTARKSARHKNYATAQLYMQDAVGLLQAAENSDPMARFQVPRFKMRISENERSHQQIVDNESEKFVSLAHEAMEFMKMLGMHGHRLCRSPNAVMKKVMRFQPQSSKVEKLDKMLRQLLPQEKVEMVQNEITQIVSETVRQMRDANESEAQPPTASQAECERRPRKRTRRHGNNDLPLRHEVKNRQGRERLQLLVEINASRPQSTTELTNSARSWVQSTLKPIMNCLNAHFGGNQNTFLDRWPLIEGVSQFAKRRCKGSTATTTCSL